MVENSLYRNSLANDMNPESFLHSLKIQERKLAHPNFPLSLENTCLLRKNLTPITAIKTKQKRKEKRLSQNSKKEKQTKY